MKKHPFICEICQSECSIYRRGKKHRVFVCPRCGVLATNGKGKILKKVAKGALRSIPVVGDIAAELIGDGTSKEVKTKPSIQRYDNLDKPNRSERIINRELYGER